MTNDFSDAPDEIELPLRDRLPEYLAVFGAGVGAGIVIGFVISLIWDVAVGAAVGYTIVTIGIVMLLAGGATGGGYTSLGIGAAGAMFGSRRTDEADEDLGESWTGRQRRSPQDRLREGLRPEANPRAFWQVIGGFAFIAFGVAVAAMFG